MHPEHPDPEAESMWRRQPGIKGIRLRSEVFHSRAVGHTIKINLINRDFIQHAWALISGL